MSRLLLHPVLPALAGLLAHPDPPERREVWELLGRTETRERMERLESKGPRDTRGRKDPPERKDPSENADLLERTASPNLDFRDLLADRDLR